MSTFGKIWWGFWGVTGLISSVVLMIFAKDYWRGGVGLFISLGMLDMVISAIRYDRKVKKGLIKETAEKITRKHHGVFGRIFSHKVALVIVLLVLTVVALSASYLGSLKKSHKIPYAQYDFPVWTMRENKVAVFERQDLYDDSSSKYIVVANTGDETQNGIIIYDVVPSVIAEDASELTFNTQPEIVSSTDPIVLKFTVDELNSQKSTIIQITDEIGGYNYSKQICEKVDRECSNYTRQVVWDTGTDTIQNYQPKAETVTAVYDGDTAAFSTEEEEFFEGVKAEAERLCNKMVYNGTTSSFPVITNAVDNIKNLFSSDESSEKAVEEEVEDEESTSVVSTELTADYFPKEIITGSGIVLNTTKDINSLDFHCKKVAPIKAMVGVYFIPEQYRKGSALHTDSSQKLEIAVYQTAEEALTAAENCGQGFYRVAGQIKPYKARMWRDGSEEMITNPWTKFVGKYENYLFYAPVEGLEYGVETQLLPAVVGQIQAQNE